MTYALGSADPELERLEQQSAMIDEPTRLLLGLAGIGRGMRVLDLGSGLGHVATALADLVGPSGQVVGIDNDSRMVAEATRRAAGRRHLRFERADVRTWSCGEPFDAVIGRLILFHLPDALEVVRHHLSHLRRGGRFVAIDFDLGGIRTEPPAPLFERYGRLVTDTFRRVGADPMIGARLGMMLVDAGLADSRSIGVSQYLPPGDPRGAAMLAGVVRSLAPRMIDARLAAADDIGIETLQRRLENDLDAARAVVLPPTLVGAWGVLQ